MDRDSSSGFPSARAAEVLELVARARAGERTALQTLIEWHEPMLERWARRRLGHALRTHDETRDVLHDAYGVVLQRIADFEPENSRSFAHWMRGIITRIVLHKARRPLIQRREAMGDEGLIHDADPTPMTRVSMRELEALRREILREGDRTDQFIYRARQRGQSAASIAERLGITDRAVRMRFARTEARIKMRMQSLLERRDAQPDE